MREAGVTRRVLSIPGLGGHEVPYFVVDGRSDGPQFTILAGVHGGEYAGIAAVREFIRDIDPRAVTGRIVAVPVLNVTAFWARAPFVVPEDGKNLNRSFPGDPSGTFAEVLAHHAFETFIRGADFMVDLHAGDLPEALVPCAIFEESEVVDASRELAVAYGPDHIVRQSAAQQIGGGRSYGAAGKLGIPGITAEAGQKGLLEREAIDRHVAGLTNVARFKGVLDGDPWPTRTPQEHPGMVYLRSSRAGWWELSIRLGAHVETGELLGTLSDVWGEGVTEVRAAESGTCLFATTSPAVSADGIILGLALD